MLLAMAAYHLVVLPSIFPVLADRELDCCLGRALPGGDRRQPAPHGGHRRTGSGDRVAVTAFFTLWESSLQERIPERAISRASSYDFFASAGLMPIGLALAGPIAAGVGLHEALFGMTAIGVALSLACLCVPGVRHLARDDDHAPIAACR